MKKFLKPSVDVINIDEYIICTSQPSKSPTGSGTVDVNGGSDVEGTW